MIYVLRGSRKVVEHARFRSGEGESEQILKGWCRTHLKFPFAYLL